MARKKQHELIQGRAGHRRTEGDYMGVLLETVTLDDWRGVVSTAKAAAKAGDPQARTWLAQFLMGKPAGNAPTPMTVVVQQLNGADPLGEKLAKPLIDRRNNPERSQYAINADHIRALVAAELRTKFKALETIDNPATARLTDQSGG